MPFGGIRCVNLIRLILCMNHGNICCYMRFILYIILDTCAAFTLEWYLTVACVVSSPHSIKLSATTTHGFQLEWRSCHLNEEGIEKEGQDVGAGEGVDIEREREGYCVLHIIQLVFSISTRTTECGAGSASPSLSSASSAFPHCCDKEEGKKVGSRGC